MTHLIPAQPGDTVHPAAHTVPVPQCPFCGTANPGMRRLWSDDFTGPGHIGWATYRCSQPSCSSVVTIVLQREVRDYALVRCFPSPKTANELIPEPSRTFLSQAFTTLHAPDAAAVMAGSAVDAMLKHFSYRDGSLYQRIDEALANHLLTEGMAKWAHSVRLGSNRPRHADNKNPHVSPEEAKQSVEFAEALGEFLFALTAKIEAGVKQANKADERERAP